MASLSKITENKRSKKRQKRAVARLKNTVRDLKKAAKQPNVIVVE